MKKTEIFSRQHRLYVLFNNISFLLANVYFLVLCLKGGKPSQLSILLIAKQLL